MARLFPGKVPMMTGLVAGGTSHPPATKLGSPHNGSPVGSSKAWISWDPVRSPVRDTPRGVNTRGVEQQGIAFVFAFWKPQIVWFSSIFVWVRLCGLHFIPDMKGIFYKLMSMMPMMVFNFGVALKCLWSWNSSKWENRHPFPIFSYKNIFTKYVQALLFLGTVFPL